MLFSVLAFAQEYIKLFSGSMYADLGVDLVQGLSWPTWEESMSLSILFIHLYSMLLHTTFELQIVWV